MESWLTPLIQAFRPIMSQTEACGLLSGHAQCSNNWLGQMSAPGGAYQ